MTTPPTSPRPDPASPPSRTPARFGEGGLQLNGHGQPSKRSPNLSPHLSRSPSVAGGPRRPTADSPVPMAGAVSLEVLEASLTNSTHGATEKMILELADGTTYEGMGFGAPNKSISGECVFQTGTLSCSLRLTT